MDGDLAQRLAAARSASTRSSHPARAIDPLREVVELRPRLRAAASHSRCGRSGASAIDCAAAARSRAAPRSKCATSASSEPSSAAPAGTERGLPQPPLLGGPGPRRPRSRGTVRLTRSRIAADTNAPHESRVEQRAATAPGLVLGVVVELDQERRRAEQRLALPQARELRRAPPASAGTSSARETAYSRRPTRASACRDDAAPRWRSAPLTPRRPPVTPERQHATSRPRPRSWRPGGRAAAATGHDQRGEPGVEIVDPGEVVQHALVDAQRRGGQGLARVELDQAPAAQRRSGRQRAPVRVRAARRGRDRTSGAGAPPAGARRRAQRRRTGRRARRRRTAAAGRARTARARRRRRARRAPAPPAGGSVRVLRAAARPARSSSAASARLVVLDRRRHSVTLGVEYEPAVKSSGVWALSICRRTRYVARDHSGDRDRQAGDVHGRLRRRNEGVATRPAASSLRTSEIRWRSPQMRREVDGDVGRRLAAAHRDVVGGRGGGSWASARTGPGSTRGRGGGRSVYPSSAHV